MHHEPVQFAKRPRVQQRVNAFACRQFTTFMLFFYRIWPAAGKGAGVCIFNLGVQRRSFGVHRCSGRASLTPKWGQLWIGPQGATVGPRGVSMRLFWSLVPCAALLGCPEPAADKEETGVVTDTSTDDSGETADTGLPDYGPPGCINLEGVTGDFATIAEAVDLAPEGTTVNVCAGAYSEQILLRKVISVVGAGSATTTLTPPAGANGIEIDAGATVSGFTVLAANHGVVVDEATGATVTDIVVDKPLGWGIRAEGALDLVISMCTFIEPQSGGVDLEGSSATVDSSLFSRPISYGIRATDGSNLVASNNIFDQVSDTGSTDRSPKKNTDGWAILGEDSEVTTSENTATTGTYGGFKVENGALAMSGDMISGTPNAIIAIESSLAADGLEVYGATGQGIYATHASVPMTLTNSTIALNGAEAGLVSCSNNYDDYDGFCGGVYLETAAATISGVSISDYESYGLIVLSALGAVEVPVTASGVTLTNNGRISLRMEYTSGTVDGLTVTGHREPDTSLPQFCYYVDQSDAALFTYSTVVVTNATIVGNRGWGITALNSDLTIESSTIADNQCAGVVNFTSTMSATGNTFGFAEQFAAVYDQQGALSLVGNQFIDTTYTATSSYDDGAGGEYRYVYSGYGKDIVLYDSVEAYVADNTFANGDSSIDVYYVGAVIENNNWIGYSDTLIRAYYADPGDPVVISSNSADDIGGTLAAAQYGSAEVEDFIVGTTRAYSYTYSAYHNEELMYSGTSTYAKPLFQAYGYYSGYYSDSDGDGIAETYTTYGEEAELSLEDIEVQRAYGPVASTQNGSLEISNLSVETALDYGIYAYWDHYVPALQLEDVYFGSTGRDAIYVVANTADEGGLVVEGLTVDVATGAGIYATGMADVLLESVTITDSSEEGIYIAGDFSSYDYATSTSTVGVRAVETTLSEVSVLGADLDGIVLSDGIASVSVSQATGGLGDGLALVDTAASITGNILTGNAFYGMSCSNVVLDACATNTLSDNTLGTHDGCDDACDD